MAKLTVKDIDLAGKKVLMRADFNVAIDKKTGDITDDMRIRAAAPTINYILEQGACVMLMSHLGRPKGEVVPQLKMDKVAQRLSQILGRKVRKLDACVGDEVKEVADKMRAGDVVLLENTRFYKQERANDPEFAKQLANLADVYVNDAFGTAHREHASTVGVAKFLPGVAGLLMAKELEALGGVLRNPTSPFIAILGGAKVSDKIGVMRSLLDRCQQILIGGGMAYTFLKAEGIPVGKSLVEEEKIEDAKQIMQEANRKNCQLVLPSDHVVAPEPKSGAETKIVGKDEIPSDWIALDIGPESIKSFCRFIERAKTVFWNGPMGYFEIDEFNKGTQEVAAKLAQVDATVVVGGGDSVAALKKNNLMDAMDHVSTGGGASLEFLEGKQLPGVAALKDKQR